MSLEIEGLQRCSKCGGGGKHYLHFSSTDGKRSATQAIDCDNCDGVGWLTHAQVLAKIFTS